MDIYGIMDKLSVTNRDNGMDFTDTQRLDVIAALAVDSDYERINTQGLFHMYSKCPEASLKGREVVVVSSHVDCHKGITKCFSKFVNEKKLLGTYDNLITNASVVYNMLSGLMPDNVLVAFTGDEEKDSEGARQVIEYLRNIGAIVKCVVVLDVTDMAWKDKADFTIENNFWSDALGKKIVSTAEAFGKNWRFVPSEPDEIPDYIMSDRLIRKEAEVDESWEYDELKQTCFSLCLPTKGEMHSNDGIYARKSSLEKYTLFMGRLLAELAATN